MNVNNSIENLKIDIYSKRVTDWLSPPDPSTNLNKALDQRHPGSGQWFLQDSVYSAWKTERKSFLWLHGIPGCGKTILSSTVIEDLGKSEASSQSLLYFYFDFTDTEKQSLEKAVRSLISQLYEKKKHVRRHLDSLYSLCGNGKRQPSNDLLQTAFQKMVEEADGVWMVLDALDECQTQKGYRSKSLFSWIKHLQNSHIGIHLLVTSRPEQVIRPIIEKWVSDNENISIQSNLIRSDICAYVHARVGEHSGLNRWKSSPEVQTEIEANLIMKANSM